MEIAKKNVAVLFGDAGNPFWQEQMRFYESLLPEYPFECEMYSPRRSRDPKYQAEYLTAILQSLSASRDSCRFDAVIINPLDDHTLADVIASKNSHSCPVFDVGPKLRPELTAELENYFPLRAADFEEQGRLCAGELADRADANAGPFAFISGPVGTRQSEGRINGAVSLARERGFECLPPVCGDFTRDGGAHAMAEILSTCVPSAVFCANDLMALGALMILDWFLTTPKAHGCTGIPLGGIDLIPEALNAVMDDRMTATAGPLGRHIVRGVLDSVMAVLDGKELPADGFLAANICCTYDSIWHRESRKTSVS